jgi:hypothetical protein
VKTKFPRQVSSLKVAASALEGAACADIWADGETCVACGISPGQEHRIGCFYRHVVATLRSLIKAIEEGK